MLRLTSSDWGEDNLAFPRRFLPYHHGLPGTGWLRLLMNRLDPGLFAACFQSWVAAVRPDAPELVAIDGKTSRAGHDRGRGRAALHPLLAFATRERLVIGQEAVSQGSCEQETIPLLLERLAAAGSLDGALVTIDAIACNPKVAAAVVDRRRRLSDRSQGQSARSHGRDRTLLRRPASALPDHDADTDKDHGRVEAHRVAVSTKVDWLKSERRFPGEYRLPEIAAILMVETETFTVRKLLQARNPKTELPARVVIGPTLLTGICYCGNCGGVMTVRTGKSGRYRYYACSMRARQGETG